MPAETPEQIAYMLHSTFVHCQYIGAKVNLTGLLCGRNQSVSQCASLGQQCINSMYGAPAIGCRPTPCTAVPVQHRRTPTECMSQAQWFELACW